MTTGILACLDGFMNIAMEQTEVRGALLLIWQSFIVCCAYVQSQQCCLGHSMCSNQKHLVASL